MRESLVGKSVLQQLDKLDKANKNKYIENRKKLSLKKDKVNSQKNILSKEEFEKKVIALNKEFENFKKEGNKKVNDLRSKRNKAMKKILDEVKYSFIRIFRIKMNLTFIIDQKNIIIGKI